MSPRIVAYAGDQTHSSLARAVRHLGFRPDQLRVLPTGDRFRIRVDDLAAAIDADAAAGRLPFLVVANAGTTSTGAIDDLSAISALCRERGVWFHIDGAYGAFAALTERGRAALAGMELADSITLDPHKWLAMPFEVGCLLVRDGRLLERAFALHPEYLQETSDERDPVNFADRGLQLTRASRAIKVWLALQTFGVGAYRAVIDRAMDLALAGQRLIEADDRLELVTPASLGVLTFRRRGGSGQAPEEIDRRNEAIVAALAASGEVLLTSTVLHGRYAIRLCVLNHTSGFADVAAAIRAVATADPVAAGPPGGHRPERAAEQAGMSVGPDLATEVGPTALRSIAAFGAATDDQAARFLATGHHERREPGEAVTERWALARTFYLVRSGRLSVRIGDQEVNTLGSGDHLGEIAAMDWGRDFAYSRTATVVATEPSELLAFPAAALRELMADNAEIDRAIRRVAQARLAAR
jgi:selenocysteine lyase/cysteine desulfurase